MIDRQRLEALLANRFPGATLEQIAAAANAIIAMIRAVEPTDTVVRARKRVSRLPAACCRQG